MDILSVLDHARQRVHDIDKIVAFIIHFVNFGATFGEIAFECILDANLNDFRVWLVADFEDVLFVDDLVEARCSCL